MSPVSLRDTRVSPSAVTSGSGERDPKTLRRAPAPPLRLDGRCLAARPRPQRRELEGAIPARLRPGSGTPSERASERRCVDALAARADPWRLPAATSAGAGPQQAAIPAGGRDALEGGGRPEPPWPSSPAGQVRGRGRSPFLSSLPPSGTRGEREGGGVVSCEASPGSGGP